MNINTNISSIVTRSFLNSNQAGLEKAMERLSSGKRINSAADDAAGLSITTRMYTQTRGKEVAMRNANDGISLIQTAESSLGSISNILQRMRELAVQADNGTYSSTDKDALQSEMAQLVSEIKNIAENTHFNGIKLLDGLGGPVGLHIGDGASDTLSFNLMNAKTDTIGGYSTTLAGASTTLFIKDITVNGAAQDDTLSNAQVAIGVIDKALDEVSSKRAEFGALQNRLEFTIDNLNSAKTNTESARSRIEDADMAAEASNMTKQNVLVQSSVAMLTQANQAPQQVLQLLQN